MPSGAKARVKVKKLKSKHEKQKGTKKSVKCGFGTIYDAKTKKCRKMSYNEREEEIMNCFNDRTLIRDSRMDEEEGYFYVVVELICQCEIYNLSKVVGVTHVTVHSNDESTIQVNITF